MNFSPSRLSTARKRRMLTKKGLAEKSGVTQQSISRWENPDSSPNPSSENVRKFSEILEFPVEFFYLDAVDEALLDVTSFRSLTSMSAARRDAALSSGSLGFELSDWLNVNFELPSVDVPDLSTLSNPAKAARELREAWGLGEKPVSNMIQLLESKGVRVLSLCEDTATVNAFSLWRSNTPFVFLNNQKSAESSRFDAAHELAHLVLHRDGGTRGRPAEDQANAFASSFLMPQADVLAQVQGYLNLQTIMRLKHHWKVSLAALGYRLHKLELLTDWAYRDFCIYLSKSGYRKREPEPVPRERSAVWTKVLTALWREGKTHYDIAEDLHLPAAEIEALIFGLLPKEESRHGSRSTSGLGLRLLDSQPPSS